MPTLLEHPPKKTIPTNRPRISVLATSMLLAGMGAIVSAVPGEAAHAVARTAAAGPAAVTTVGYAAMHAAGYEARTYIRSGGCEGWVYTTKRSGHWHAQGVLRSRYNHCIMYLARRHGSGGYVQVSQERRAINETVRTGYHWDDRGYRARVCIQNYDHKDEQYRCGKGV
ncbi:hypothetical protein [Microtetraspora glauca]|uniref:Uncharacterized protein n=1 Tax=Microtetraspora glauca TaxID=1996 RepID=A0ABV3GKC5_MICGL